MGTDDRDEVNREITAKKVVVEADKVTITLELNSEINLFMVFKLVGYPPNLTLIQCVRVKYDLRMFVT